MHEIFKNILRDHEAGLQFGLEAYSKECMVSNKICERVFEAIKKDSALEFVPGTFLAVNGRAIFDFKCKLDGKVYEINVEAKRG